MEIAQFYTDAFFDDCKKLNIKTPDVGQVLLVVVVEHIIALQPGGVKVHVPTSLTPEHQFRKNVQVQGGVFDGVPAGGEGL